MTFRTPGGCSIHWATRTLYFCAFITILYFHFCSLITFLQGNTSFIGTFLMAVNKQNQSQVNTLVSNLIIIFVFSIFVYIYVNVCACRQCLIYVFQALRFVGWMKWEQFPNASVTFLHHSFSPPLNWMHGIGYCLVTANPSASFSTYKLQYNFLKLWPICIVYKQPR